MGMSDCAFIVVDMQLAFLKKQAQFIDKVSGLVKTWPAEHTYWTRYKNHPGSLFERYLNWSDCMVAPCSDLIPAPWVDERNVRDHFGYGLTLEFMNELKSFGYKEAALCGVDTDACVMAAAFNLWDNDIRPIVMADYCASSGGKNLHEAALDLMYRQFGVNSVVQDRVSMDFANLSS